MFSFLTKKTLKILFPTFQIHIFYYYIQEHGPFMEFFFVFCYASLTEVNNKFLMAGSEIITYERIVWEKT